MTPDELDKIQQISAIRYQIYELNRKQELLIASLQPRRGKPEKYNREKWLREFDELYVSERKGKR
jgi:hypothetical protein